MILVAGATGTLGSEICRQLRERGNDVAGLVRSTSDPQKLAMLRGLGVELRVGDLKDRASLQAVCKGIAACVSTANAIMPRSADDNLQTVDRDGQIALIDAARSAGVQQFVYVSISGNVPQEMPLAAPKRAAEQALIESGLRYTILRPTFFLEVWLSPMMGFDIKGASARVIGGGRAPISWISYRDVAAFAVSAIGNPAATNRIVELGGPEALSLLQSIAVFEEMTAQRFAVEDVPVEALRQQVVGGDPAQSFMAGVLLGTAHPDVIDMSQTVRDFPVRLTSVRDYAKQVLAK